MADDRGAVLRVWRDAPARGPENMARDEALASEAERRGEVLLRLSTWDRPEVSLGAFQPLAAARGHEGFAGLPIFRRPSGGGAIVHGSDLTLAIAVPRSHPRAATPQALYDLVHDSLVGELRSRGVPAERSRGAPDLDERLLCFERRALGDVVVTRHTDGGDDKVFGSAQRRLRGAVLQHGSLLVASNDLVPAVARHPGLADLAPQAGPWTLEAGIGVVDGWLDRIADRLGARAVAEVGPFLPPDGGGYGEALVRYGDVAWVARR